jgi:hypothetical protein
MRKTMLAFQHEIRRWSGEIPLGTIIYVALQALNDSVGLTLQQLSAAVDEGKRAPNGWGVPVCTTSIDIVRRGGQHVRRAGGA